MYTDKQLQNCTTPAGHKNINKNKKQILNIYDELFFVKINVWYASKNNISLKLLDTEPKRKLS